MADAAAWTEAIGTASATLLAAGSIAGALWDRRRRTAVAISGVVHIEDGMACAVELFNRSEEPVFDLVARVIYKGETIAMAEAGVLTPGTATIVLAEPHYEVYACAADLLDVAPRPRVALIFRDQGGRTWRRRSNGKLRRRRWKYNHTTEYTHALAETPPMLTEQGEPIDTGVRRRSPVD